MWQWQNIVKSCCASFLQASHLHHIGNMICPKTSTPGGNCPELRKEVGNCRKNSLNGCIIDASQRWRSCDDYNWVWYTLAWKMVLNAAGDWDS